MSERRELRRALVAAEARHGQGKVTRRPSAEPEQCRRRRGRTRAVPAADPLRAGNADAAAEPIRSGEACRP